MCVVSPHTVLMGKTMQHGRLNETWTISDDFDEGEDGGEPPYLLYSF